MGGMANTAPPEWYMGWERPLGRGEGNRSPRGPQWQWERPLGMQGVGGETMGGDDKHSPLKMGYGMEETPGPWGRERKPPGTTVAVGVTPNDGGEEGRALSTGEGNGKDLWAYRG